MGAGERRLDRGRVRMAVVVVLVGALVALGLQAVAVAPAGAVVDIAGMTTFRDIIVDPTSGRVFVSGDNSVVVFDAAGAYQSTITGIPGAGGMDIVGSSLWVAETAGAKIAEIDLTTRTVSREIAAGGPVTGRSIVAVGGYVYFPDGTMLRRLDPATSTVTNRGAVVLNEIERVGTSTTTLLTHGYGGQAVGKVNLSTNPATVVASGSGGQNLNQVAVDPTRMTYVYASGAPNYFGEVALATMADTGVNHRASGYPAAIAYTPGRGGLFVGATQSFNRVSVWKPGSPAPLATFDLGGDVVARGVAASADGSTAYAIQRKPFTSNVLELVALPTASTISSILPSTVIAGVPTTISILGRALGSITSASVGGLPATATVDSPTSARVTMPTGLAPGARTLSLATPLGIATTTIQVTPNTGAGLTGTITDRAGPVAGVQLSLSGGPLASPVTTTSAADGTYTFANRAYGTTYRLTAHDPSGARPDQTLGGITLVPNNTTVRDLVMATTQTGEGAVLSSTPLASPAREILVEPTTNRVFVSTGDEVLVFDRDGLLLVRIAGQWGAEALTRNGTDVYVNQVSAGVIARIDAVTLTVTGSWSTGLTTTAGMAFAGGRLWFARPKGFTLYLVSLDPTTGTTVESIPEPGWLGVNLRSIEGSTTRFISGGTYNFATTTYVMDASTPTPTIVVSKANVGFLVAASAPLDRLWNRDGAERSLTTLEPTGTHYPSASGSQGINTAPVAFSPAQGGVLGFGSLLHRVGASVTTHDLPDLPEAEAFDATAERVFYATPTSFVVWDLAPHVESMGPAPVRHDSTSVTLRGSGLATTTSVTIDGASKSFTPTGTDTLAVTFAALPLGLHSIQVITPFGSSVPLGFSVTPRPPRPTVTSISPPTVGTTGGTVTIHGTNLTDATSVTFGDTAPISYTVVDDSTITAWLPVHAPGTVTVTVTTESGGNLTSPPFSWVAPRPAITDVNPSNGRADQTTNLSITGSGFLFATSVTIGGTSVPFTVIDDTWAYVAVPPHAPGTVGVAITTPGGTSPAHVDARFTFDPVTPAVQFLDPTFGSIAGGDEITITGSDLSWVTGVLFGTTPATAFTVVDAATIRATAPPGTDGDVTVNLTSPYGNSVGTAAARFTYVFEATTFHGMAPVRLLDSRTPTGGWNAELLAGQPRALTVAGTSGVPADASAVVLNVTVADPTAESFLTAYPNGTVEPNASNLNFGAGQIIANLVTVRVGDAGKVMFKNAAGSTNVVVDIVGYYRTGSGERFNGIPPTRVLDSRFATGWSGPLGAGQANVRRLDVTVGDVPDTATSVIMNVTVADGSADSFLQVWPTGAARPSSSNVNFRTGAITSNLVTTKVGADGTVSFFNAVGATNVIADIVGYYDPTQGSVFHPLRGPRRFLDDRFGVGATGPWPSDQTRTVPLGAGIGIPTGATGAVFNATVTGGSAYGYVTVYPPGQLRPTSSSLNFAPGQTVANLAVVAVEPTNAVNIYNNTGTVDVIGDAVGFFSKR